MQDPRFRVGAYLTDKVHLLCVERVKRVGTIAPKTKLVVRDCNTHRIEDESTYELFGKAVLDHHRLVVPEIPGIRLD